MKTRARLRLFGVGFLMLWVLYTLYPQPADLFKSVYRLFNPPVNPYYVSGYFEHYIVFQPPQINLRRSFDSFWTAFWHYMPDSKKRSLVVGLLITLIFMLTPGVVARPVETFARRRVER